MFIAFPHGEDASNLVLCENAWPVLTVNGLSKRRCTHYQKFKHFKPFYVKIVLCNLNPPTYSRVNHIALIITRALPITIFTTAISISE